MSEHVALEFEAPTGDRLSFEWDADRLAELDPEPPDRPLWELAGELDWDEIERVRVLSARLGDGRLLAIGAIGDRDRFEHLDEALLSAEYGADGKLRRIGLELHSEVEPLAIRASGVVASISRSTNGGVERVSAIIELSAGGSGVLDLVTRA